MLVFQIMILEKELQGITRSVYTYMYENLLCFMKESLNRLAPKVVTGPHLQELPEEHF
jgi:hypothetical protein